jgi:hypothetical protein
VQYAENILAARVSAAATWDELQTEGKQAAMELSPPDTKFSGEHQHFDVEQPLKPRKFSQDWAQLSWSAWPGVLTEGSSTRSSAPDMFEGLN